MNNFKNSLDKINLSEEEKRKYYKNILSHKKEKKGFQVYALRFAIFILALFVFTGTSYAFVKLFHFDETLKSFFGESEEKLNEYGIGGTEINNTKKYGNDIVTIGQTTFDSKELYISVNIKAEDPYLTTAFISEGEIFNDNKINTSILEDGSVYRYANCNSNDAFCDMSFALLEQKENENNYGITFTTMKEKQVLNQKFTLRLYTKEKYYDITFTLSENEMRSKEENYDTIVYESNKITAKVKSIKLTPLHLNIEFEFNIDNLNQELITEIDKNVFNSYLNDNSYIIYKDGSKQIMRLLWNYNEETLNHPYAYYDKNDLGSWQVINIDEVKSITINNITFNLEDGTVSMKKIANIIDKTTTEEMTCASVLDKFYEDNNYEYYFSCAKSSIVIVKYTDGTEEDIETALNNNHIKISDLDNYNISYIKEVIYKVQ